MFCFFRPFSAADPERPTNNDMQAIPERTFFALSKL